LGTKKKCGYSNSCRGGKPDEVRRIIGKTSGRLRVLLVTAIFTGLRASELRGLRWPDVDLKKAKLHVRQRADRYCAMGTPKSEALSRLSSCSRNLASR
jgi:integrase